MPVIEALRQDVRGALRGLWKSPGFALAALITNLTDAGEPVRLHVGLVSANTFDVRLASAVGPSRRSALTP